MVGKPSPNAKPMIRFAEPPWNTQSAPWRQIDAQLSQDHLAREIRQRFPWLKTIYWRNAFWAVGLFSSTVGVNEDVIKRYVEFQEKVDTGKAQLDFGF